MTTILEALETEDRAACLAIRVEVFCGEQKVARDFELDGLDDLCRHYLARHGDGAVGTARSRPLDGGGVKLERIAVLKPYRGREIGKALTERALSDARKDGYATAVLHSQSHVGPFYEKLGFRREGDEFEEAGIPHVRMVMTL